MSGFNIFSADETPLNASSATISSYLQALSYFQNLQLPKVLQGPASQHVHFINFDGTGNSIGVPENQLSNPALLAGELRKNYTFTDVGYITGVATQGGAVYTTVDAMIAASATSLIQSALRQVAQAYSLWAGSGHPPEQEFYVVVSGFSRGSAEARLFLNAINKYGIPAVNAPIADDFSFSQSQAPGGTVRASALLFDTVTTSVRWNGDYSIPGCVDSVVHFTSRDDSRGLFDLTSIVSSAGASTNRLLEIELPGMHSDIGGGYSVNGVSNIALNMAETALQKWGVNITPNTLDLSPSSSIWQVHDSRSLLTKAYRFFWSASTRDTDYVRTVTPNAESIAELTQLYSGISGGWNGSANVPVGLRQGGKSLTPYSFGKGDSIAQYESSLDRTYAQSPELHDAINATAFKYAAEAVVSAKTTFSSVWGDSAFEETPDGGVKLVGTPNFSKIRVDLQTLYASDKGAAFNEAALLARTTSAFGQTSLGGYATLVSKLVALDPRFSQVFTSFQNFDDIQNVLLADNSDSGAITGSERGDLMLGFGGVDTLTGGAGSDTLWAGSSNDFLWGGEGGDGLFGEDGVDELNGGDGDDSLSGGQDNDTLTGGNGGDVYHFQRGSGFDVINAISEDGSRDYLSFDRSFDGRTASLRKQGSDLLIDWGNGDSELVKNWDSALVDIQTSTFKYTAEAIDAKLKDVPPDYLYRAEHSYLNFAGVLSNFSSRFAELGAFYASSLGYSTPTSYLGHVFQTGIDAIANGTVKATGRFQNGQPIYSWGWKGGMWTSAAGTLLNVTPTEFFDEGNARWRSATSATVQINDISEAAARGEVRYDFWKTPNGEWKFALTDVLTYEGGQTTGINGAMTAPISNAIDYWDDSARVNPDAGIVKLDAGGVIRSSVAGTNQSDAYFYNRGDGSILISESDPDVDVFASRDVFSFSSGISIESISANRSGADMVIDTGGSDKITVKNWFTTKNTPINQIELFKFAGGAELTAAELTAKALQKTGTAGHDQLVGLAGYDNTLDGGAGADTLDGGDFNDVMSGGEGSDALDGHAGADDLSGGAGNDILGGAQGGSDSGKDGDVEGLGNSYRGDAGNDLLRGTAWSDTYYFNLGDGRDLIQEFDISNSLTSSSDVLKMGPGINRDTVQVTRKGVNLFLTVNSTDSIEIENWYSQSSSVSNRIERVEFEDGSYWTAAELTAWGLEVRSTSGADTFFAFRDFPAVYIAGAGNDVVTGGVSADWLDGEDGADKLYGLAGRDQLIGGAGNDLLMGGDDDDNLMGGEGSDALDGGAGYDFLHGGAGNDVLGASPNTDDAGRDNNINQGQGNNYEGGQGNDLLKGTTWSDTYIFAAGDGRDLIQEFDAIGGPSGQSDTLKVGYGISASQTQVRRNGTNLLLVANGADSVEIANWFTAPGSTANQLEQVVFLDETVWTAAELTQRALVTTGTNANDTLRSYGDFGSTLNAGAGSDSLLGGSGADVLNGEAGNDVLGDVQSSNDSGRLGDISGVGNTYQGGTGNDLLRGTAWSDTYLFNLGDGHDLLQEFDLPGGSQSVDVIKFGSGINVDALVVKRSGSSLLLICNGADSVEVANWFPDSGLASNRVERVEFSNGINLSAAQLTEMALTQRGSAAAEALVGLQNYSNTLYGQLGNDSLTGGTLADKLFGGAGADSLFGGSGSDSYYYVQGDGLDTISDSSGTDDALYVDGVDLGAINYWRAGSDLRIDLGAGAGVLVKNQFGVNSPGSIEAFYLNGSAVTANEMSILAKPLPA